MKFQGWRGEGMEEGRDGERRSNVRGEGRDKGREKGGLQEREKIKCQGKEGRLEGRKMRYSTHIQEEEEEEK